MSVLDKESLNVLRKLNSEYPVCRVPKSDKVVFFDNSDGTNQFFLVQMNQASLIGEGSFSHVYPTWSIKSQKNSFEIEPDPPSYVAKIYKKLKLPEEHKPKDLPEEHKTKNGSSYGSDFSIETHEREAAAYRAVKGYGKLFNIKPDSQESISVFIQKRIQGDSLTKIQQSENPLTSSEIIDIAINLNNDLIDIHSKSVLHLDVSANNVLVDRKKKTAKLCDYGRAIKIEDFGRPKLYPYLISPKDINDHYHPPEFKDKKASLTSDTYMLGKLLIEHMETAGNFPQMSSDDMNGDKLKNIVYKFLKQMTEQDCQKRKTTDEILNFFNSVAILFQIDQDNPKNFEEKEYFFNNLVEKFGLIDSKAKGYGYQAIRAELKTASSNQPAGSTPLIRSSLINQIDKLNSKDFISTLKSTNLECSDIDDLKEYLMQQKKKYYMNFFDQQCYNRMLKELGFDPFGKPLATGYDNPPKTSPSVHEIASYNF